MTFVEKFKGQPCTEKDLEKFILDWHNSRTDIFKSIAMEAHDFSHWEEIAIFC